MCLEENILSNIRKKNCNEGLVSLEKTVPSFNPTPPSASGSPSPNYQSPVPRSNPWSIIRFVLLPFYPRKSKNYGGTCAKSTFLLSQKGIFTITDNKKAFLKMFILFSSCSHLPRAQKPLSHLTVSYS